MNIDVTVVNAFLDGDHGGNPAGVVLDAQHLSREQKQAIATAMGLSEVAFVSPSAIADYKLEFFTPTRQIAQCGHATVASFSCLRSLGKLLDDKTSMETIDGSREILMEDETAFMQQLAPQYTELSEAQHKAVLKSLLIKESSLFGNARPTIVNTGNAFLMIALSDAAMVKSLLPDMQMISALSDELDLIGYYVFALNSEQVDRDAGTRMFAPRYGINEESATGAAAGPLACFMYDKMQNKKTRYHIEQGYWMSPVSPSVIQVRMALEDGIIQSVLVGGRAAVSQVRSLTI